MKKGLITSAARDVAALVPASVLSAAKALGLSATGALPALVGLPNGRALAAREENGAITLRRVMRGVL